MCHMMKDIIFVVILPYWLVAFCNHCTSCWAYHVCPILWAECIVVLLLPLVIVQDHTIDKHGNRRCSIVYDECHHPRGCILEWSPQTIIVLGMHMLCLIVSLYSCIVINTLLHIILLAYLLMLVFHVLLFLLISYLWSLMIYLMLDLDYRKDILSKLLRQMGLTFSYFADRKHCQLQKTIITFSGVNLPFYRVNIMTIVLRLLTQLCLNY